MTGAAMTRRRTPAPGIDLAALRLWADTQARINAALARDGRVSRKTARLATEAVELIVDMMEELERMATTTEPLIARARFEAELDDDLAANMPDGMTFVGRSRFTGADVLAAYRLGLMNGSKA